MSPEATVDAPVDLTPFGLPSGSVQGIDPSNDLRGKTITPEASERLQGREAMSDAALADIAKVDRFGLARDKFNTFAKDTEGAYNFANRQATLGAAAKGRVGSGMLRTDYGNLDLARSRDLDSARDRFLNDALEGSIDDSFRKANALTSAEGTLVNQGRQDRQEVRGERDYENEMERQSFGRARQEMLDRDMLTNSQFDRDTRRVTVGEAGNPGGAEIDVAQGRRRQAQLDAEEVAGLFGEMGNQDGLGGQGSQGPPPGMTQEQIDEWLTAAGTPNGAAPTEDEGPPVIVGTSAPRPAENQLDFEKRGLIWAPGTRSHGQPRP